MNAKKTVYLILSLFGILAIQHCTEESPLISENESVVVQAYLYAGEPVDDIRLTVTLPLDADTDAVPLPITTATVRLIKNNIAYELRAMSANEGYYEYPDSDLTVEAGDQFRLEIEYNFQTIWAYTTVPEEPVDVELSDTVITVPDFTDFESMRGWIESDSSQNLTLTWENDSTQFFYVNMENTDSNPVEIENSFGDRQFRWVTRPINDNHYSIQAMQFSYLGHYRLILYRVNQEYVDLYESRNQDSRDLNEPLTNICNGLGIFTAFNSVSKTFLVIQ